MPADTYPNIKCTVEEINKKENTISSQFENGWEQSRSRWSKGLRTFVLKYNMISLADYEILYNFFEDRRGSAESFYFYFPRDNTPVTCKFASDELKAVPRVWPGHPDKPLEQVNARFDITIELREVF